MKPIVSAFKGGVKFAVGTGMSVTFVATMDDYIYAQFRKNIVLPFQMVMLNPAIEGEQAESDVTLSEGIVEFGKQMAPKSIIPQNAKDLMIRDSDYSTP